MQANEEVGFGVIGVQTLGAAAVTLLQGFTLEGWAFTMQTQANGDSRSDGLVIYTAFPVMVIIGGMLLMNLAIAVLWEAFDRHHSEAPTRPAILKESEWRVYQLLGTDWIKYLMVELDQKKNCISEHIPPSSLEIEDTTAQTDVGFLAKIKRMCSGHWRTLCRRVIRELEIRFPEIQNRLRFLFMELKGYAFRLATNKFFSVAMLVLVVLDIICMFAHTDNATSVVLSVLDLLSSSAFVLEAIVLLLAFGKRCMEDGFLCLDILAAILAVIDGFFALLLCSEIVGCRSSIVKIEGVLGTVAVVLSLVRPLRIFKLLKFFSSLRLTAELLLTLHNTLLPYILLIIYCCAVVAQLGLFLFFDPKYVSTHAGTVSLNLTKYFNFENAGNSLLLLLTIFTGEAWDVFVKEIDQVYSGELESLTFDSHKLSDKILSAPSRVTAINTFLFFSVLFLNCLIFNLYGAIMIGQFTQTQKALSVKYAARFISTCRIAGIAMPAADALQGENAQALYTQANMATVAERDELIKAITTGADHAKSAKALDEFARKTSIVLDICKTVARKSSRMASKANSNSQVLGADKGGSRSNSCISAMSKPQKRELIGEIAFDKVMTERGLSKRPEEAGGINTEGTTQESSSTSETNGSKASTAFRKGGEPSGLPFLDDFMQMEITNKAAVKFAADDHTVFLAIPHGGSRAASSTMHDLREEELSIGELCTMFWAAIKEVMKQGRIALRAGAAAVIERITPVDPDSPFLHIAYAGHMVRADCEVLYQQPSGQARQLDNKESNGSEFGTITEIRAKPGSSGGFTFQKRFAEAHAKPQSSQQLPSCLQTVYTVWRAFTAHIRDVCGISGIGWIRLLLHFLSLGELIADCCMKKDTTVWRTFVYIELGAQVALTVDIFMRIVIGVMGKSSPFFYSRFNCYESVLQLMSWCFLTASLLLSSSGTNGVMVRCVWFRFAQCARVLRCVWLLRLLKNTGIHRLALAMLSAGNKIFSLGFIFILIVTFFALGFRLLLQPVAGDPPAVPLATANLTSLGESFLSVFILTTAEDWPRILISFLDLGERHQCLTIILCALVVSLLSIFVMNLFVGILVDVLDQEQETLEYTGGVRSATVLRWNEMQRAIFSSASIEGILGRNGGSVRSKGLGSGSLMARIITDKKVDVAIALVSAASCVTMLAAGAWAEADIRWHFPEFQLWIFWFNAAIVIGYVLEQCIRLVVLGRSLFEKPIFIVDLANAFISLIALIWGLSTSLDTAFPAEPLWPVAFRMIRVAYVACNYLPGMRVLSISLFNMFASLRRALFFFGFTVLVYTLIGTCLFHDVPYDPKLHLSFESFLDTIVLLLSCSTGENWHDIMLQGRTYYYETDMVLLAWVLMGYVISFVALVFFLLMNVFTSAVLKGYVDAKRNQELWKVAQEHQDLLNKWRLREMKLSWLPIHVALQVLNEIQPPIGFKNLYIDLGCRRMHAILAHLAAYPLPVHNNSVHIRDMVLNTACLACEAHAQRRETPTASDPSQGPQKVELNPRLVYSWMSHFSDASAVKPEFDILQYLAALKIQAFWRTNRLLQSNTASNQLMYMKHLLFLLEKAGPLCAHKQSKGESRRSTLRRKRLSKNGGSFVQRATVLTRVGTFARDHKVPRGLGAKLKNALKSACCGKRSGNQDKRLTQQADYLHSQCQSVPEEERLTQEEQRQRQRSLLHRSEASECITDLLEGGQAGQSDRQSDLYEKELNAELHQDNTTSLRKQSTRETSSGEDDDVGEAATTEPDAEMALAAAAAASRLSASRASAVSRFPEGAAVDSHLTADQAGQGQEPPAVTAPRRSSMRAPQSCLVPPPPRRSLLIAPLAHRLQRQSTAEACQPDSPEPPRRRGQSVQFTGVDRLELQKFLAPAMAQNESSSSEEEGNSHS
ncbi:cation channel domain-containing protein, putative [Eimeria tenella]|uniref:Cation channel domain-containing protein, putative n=1 Tax=Eimeria tenella TaxID=5802 RepID=U6KLC9_EIMTE|nr:cation channel domain-containing protein, putative [Eimeria tenella]CDJ37621.1 cation channel domain-containing protein, putative [Eimeria tenella]|eukprot:XP_013228459.1 cation channel domain-containing protein, putative [Eimeria tenella]